MPLATAPHFYNFNKDVGVIAPNVIYLFLYLSTVQFFFLGVWSRKCPVWGRNVFAVQWRCYTTLTLEHFWEKKKGFIFLCFHIYVVLRQVHRLKSPNSGLDPNDNNFMQAPVGTFDSIKLMQIGILDRWWTQLCSRKRTNFICFYLTIRPDFHFNSKYSNIKKTQK